MPPLVAQGEAAVPPPFSDRGSNPPPIPALEQNSAIAPNCRSVSSMTWRMSRSCPTSHLNAAPSTEAATACAPARSRSATTTLAAPARWKASHSARPMPLAPPVTTTTLPVTCIVTSEVRKSSGQDEIEDCGVMAGRAPQHEGMPDRVLETQALPCMKDDPETVQKAAKRDEPQWHCRQRRPPRVIDHPAAPAHRQIEADRRPVEAAREYQLQHDPADRH